MNIEERNAKYNAYVEAKMPKTKPWPSLFRSFWVKTDILSLEMLILFSSWACEWGMAKISVKMISKSLFI